MQVAINLVFEKYDDPYRNSGHNYAFTESDCKRMIRDGIIEGRYLKMKEIAHDLIKAGWSIEQITKLFDVTQDVVEKMLK